MLEGAAPTVEGRVGSAHSLRFGVGLSANGQLDTQHLTALVESQTTQGPPPLVTGMGMLLAAANLASCDGANCVRWLSVVQVRREK